MVLAGDGGGEMMDFVFDLQLFGFGGGESSTTSREIPEQSANEKALENYLLQSGSLGGNMAPYAYQAFAGSLNDVFTPNFNSLFKQYTNRTDNARGAYTDYYQDIQDALKANTNTYWRRSKQNLSDYQSKMDSALADYNQKQGQRSSLWDDLVNGVLPDSYAANRQAALNADLKGTVGSAINSLASRGVVNSGVGNKALDDISQSASDTLAKRYADDLALQASLLGQDRANTLANYETNAGNANNQFTNAQNMYNSAISTYNDMYKTKNSANDNWFNNVNSANNNLWNGAISGQNASLQVPTQYLSYAGTLSTPTENLYNTMYSGRMGTGSTTTTKDDGGAGAMGAIGSLGAAAIMCFEGDTLVTTPAGYKYIRDIHAGDEVLSVKDGEIVAKVVKSVTEPIEKEIIDVVFENGQVWHTTRGQRYYGGTHFHFVEGGKSPVMVLDGEPTRVLKVVYSGRKAFVYDIRVEGFKGENVFFANDVGAEGFGE
jgi:hypothetical protein